MTQAMTPEEIKAKLEGAIAECMQKVEAGEYKTLGDAVEAVVADLKKLEDEPKKMGGLGIDNEDMNFEDEEGAEEGGSDEE